MFVKRGRTQVMAAPCPLATSGESRPVDDPGMATEGTPAGSRVAWKELLIKGLYGCGAVRLSEQVARFHELPSAPGAARAKLRRASMPRFAILCYHRIGAGGIPFYSELPAETFEKQMRYLRNRYRIVSLDQLIQEIDQPRSLEPAVAITFDDGYRDLFTQAFPVLQEYRVPATIFLTVGCIETGDVAWYDRIFLALKIAPGDRLDLVLDGPRRFALSSEALRMRAAVEIITHLRSVSRSSREECCAALERQIPLPTKELRDRMLSWEQIRTMDRAGISFGSHTMSHPVVSRLSPLEMEKELLESKRILEQKLGHPVQSFAFPFGKREECGDAARQILTRGKYRSAVTTEWGLNTRYTDPMQLNRVSIGEERSLAMFAFQLNRLFLRTTFDHVGAGSKVSSEARQAPEEARSAAR